MFRGGSLVDTFTCKNTPSTLKTIGLMTLLAGLTIFILGIVDVTHYANCTSLNATSTNGTTSVTTTTKAAITATAATTATGTAATAATTSAATTKKASNTTTTATPTYIDFELTQIGVGVWGSLPIIFVGLLAMYGASHPEYSLKYLALLSVAAGFLFAPAVLVVSAIDANKQIYLRCTEINNVSVSIALAAFGGIAVFLLQIINYRLCCSNFDEDGDNEELVNQPVRAKRSNIFFAEKDQWMKSNIPEEPTFNNGSEVLKPSLAQPTHTIYVPYSIMRSPGPQPQYMWGGGAMMGRGGGGGAMIVRGGGGGGGGMFSGGKINPDGIYPMIPAQMPAAPQQPAMIPQGGVVKGGQPGDPGYYINFVGGDRVNTNVYPQFYKLG